MNNRFSASIGRNLKNIHMKHLINRVDLYRREFCAGEYILFFKLNV